MRLWRAYCSCGRVSPRLGARIGVNLWANYHRGMEHEVIITDVGTWGPWKPTDGIDGDEGQR